MKYSLQQDRHEIIQSYIRFIFMSAILLFFGIFKPEFYKSTQHIFVTFGFISFANIHFYLVYNKKSNFFFRRITAIIADIVIVFYFMNYLDINAIVLYPLLLWIILGNGIRFGATYLYISLTFTLTALYITTILNNSWQGHLMIIFSLAVGIISISLLTLLAIRNLHDLNMNLEQKVDQRVKELEYEYLHDSLTDLFNRFALEKDLQEEKFGGLMIIDIDSFRNINELYGIHTGDAILKKIASHLRQFLNNKEFQLYRINGDVFAAKNRLDYIDHDLYEKVVKDLLNFVDTLSIDAYEINTSINIDITIGISLEHEDALNKAEMALSFAKLHMKKYIAYSKMIDTSQTISQLLQCKDEIKEALNQDNFIPVFQPIVNRNQNIVKYEALIRMRKYTNGKEELISPYFFLDTAIKTKQYETLTIIMIEKSFKIMKALGKSFSLNLSFNDLINEKVLNTLKINIEKYDIGKQLTLEILESENIEDYQVINNFIKEFKTFGIEIAIDDFGSGFSNFTHVFELEPDILKIDGSLIKNIDKDQKSYEFVKSIVHLAHKLGIQTLAEFVSSKEIFDITYDLGVDYFQGYYFCEPIPSSKIKDKFTFTK